MLLGDYICRRGGRGLSAKTWGSQGFSRLIGDT